jgi:multiple sugar transport system permease protein
MTAPPLSPTLILRETELLQFFRLPIRLNPATAVPGFSSIFFNLNLYQTFFTFQELSYGATMAWLLFGIALAITLILFRLSRRYVYYAGER